MIFDLRLLGRDSLQSLWIDLVIAYCSAVPEFKRLIDLN